MGKWREWGSGESGEEDKDREEDGSGKRGEEMIGKRSV